MESKLYPYQYNHIKSLILNLNNVYKTVNDVTTIKTIQADTRQDIINQFEELDEEIENILEIIMNLRLSKKQVENVLKILRNYVTPFKLPTQKQVEKVFKKVKKIKLPSFSEEELLISTFLGWNDNSSNRKYIIYYDENNQLNGFFGELSNQTVKGFCSICNKESDVSLFLRKTKSSGDGQYTKKGDYICHDSTHCNEQITDLTHFYHFINKIQ